MATITGTSCNDTITGGSGADTILGLAGNDSLSGGGGNDILRGGTGNDKIDGGSGADIIDFSDATGGINFALVQSSSYTSVNLTAVGLGTESYKNIEGVIATNFNDTLTGSTLNDVLSGGGGNDILRGRAGNDTIDGGSGTDIIDFSDATGGISFTLVQSSSSTSVNVSAVCLGTDTYKNIEGVIGTNFADMLTGSSYADTIYGGGGSDTIVGGLGGDLLAGGSGTDIFVFRTNSDSAVSDSLYASGGPILAPFTSVHVWDIITDFTHNEDKLDLSQLNTRLTGAGPSVLAWLGEKGADVDAGTLNSSRAHGVWANTDHTFIYADIDGDGRADMKIQVSNVDSSDVIGVNHAPNITVGVGDGAVASLTETNAGRSTSGALTVVDVDLSDAVSPSVQSVALSGVTGGLTPGAVLSMLTVSPSSIAADPGAANNLHWAFDSGGQAFNFLAAGEQLTLTYTVKVDDGHAGSATQAVAITINGTNDAPLGADDSASATEKGGTNNTSGGSDATGNVIANDTDVDSSGLTVSAIRTGGSEDAGTAGTLGAGLAGVHGTLTLAADGSYTYVIDETDAAVQALNSGDTLSDSFNYTVQDAGGLTDTAVLTISINGANDAPLGADDSASATEKGGTNNTSGGSDATGNVIANDTDVDSSGLTVSAIRTGGSEDAGTAGTLGAGLAGVHGTLTLAADGSYTYVIDETDAAVQALNSGDTLSDSFNYTVQDAGGLTDTAVLTISIDGANDAPLGADDSASATEKGGTNNASGGSDATGNVIANDTDVDSSGLTVSAIRTGGSEDAGTAGTLGAGLAGAHGTLTLAADGSYTYVIDETDAAVQALNSGDTLSDSFNYTVQDAGGLTDTAVLTIAINGTNDAPIMTSGATASTPENVSTMTPVYTAMAIDSDSPTLTYSFGGGVDDSKFSIDGASGAVTFKVSPNFESPTDSGANNIYDIIVKASDGALFDTKAVSITVTNANQAPTAVADIVLTTAGSGATVSIPEAALLANDTDADSLSLDVAVGSVGSATSGTVAHVAGSGSNGSIRFTDDSAAAGSFQYAATDGSLVGVAATVSITNAFTGTGTRTIIGTGSDEILIGFAGRDSLNGAGGNDIIIGTGGGDTLVGGTGNDSIVYNEGASSANSVVIHGDVAAAPSGTGSDTLVLTDAATINLSASNQTSASFTAVTGFENVDASRSDAAVTLRGSNGVNTLIGGSGADGIFGGNGADNLTGGAGADTFVYAAVSNSNHAGFDTITDFTSGSDKIQLNVVTAITTAQGALATATSSVAAHSVAWFFDVANNQTILYGNPTDGALSGGDAGLGEVHLANTLTFTGGDFVFGGAPAGIAGEPIALALANPTSDVNVQIAVSVSGVPSGWSLNAGTSNGDGIWTVHTNDPSALTVTTDAGFTGATVLTVTETWTNGDGTPGRATVLDNVEAYAPGSPIFAVSTDDNLTGSTGEDLFVFARPIGNNTIYNFDAAADKIDLIGFADFTTFADLAITNDSHGNASIALGAGSQITLLGIDPAALTAGNFEFDVEPVITNIGTMAIGDGATLPLGGTIENTGVIALDASGNDTYLEILFRGATLTGGGQLVMSDSSQNAIYGGNGDTALVNHDNIISGAGQLGAGQLTLINEGTIVANGSHALVIDTGSSIATNSGTMEATGSAGLVVESALANTGSLWAHGGSITLHGDVTGAGSATISGAATLEFGAASDANVAFADGAAGMLKLDFAAGFTGTVSGFAAGDSIDLCDVVYADGMQLSYTANDAGTGGTLIVSDGTHSAYITLMGQYQAAGMQADGQGGTLLAFDAPAVDHNMRGGTGNDALTGGNNNDTLTGGAGVDMLTGGLGDDLFDYNAISDSGVGAGNRDLIADFQAHADAMANSDAIDLSAIDAITGDGDDAFAFVANADPAANPGVVANSVTWYHSGGNTIVQIDNTGDTTAESEIELAGLHTLASTDFIL